MTDDTNPKMALQTAHTEILCRVARGEIDLNLVASAELADRGMDEQGRWVGFTLAAALHEARTALWGHAPPAPAIEKMAARITNRNIILKSIAQSQLSIETLETRKRDDLDFHDLAVWQIRAALEEAYKAGQRATP